MSANASALSSAELSGTLLRITPAPAEHGARYLIAGELDLASARQAERALRAVVETGEGVVLDLSDLTYCDSQGLRMFFTLATTARSSGGSLVLANPQQRVRRVFDIVELARTIDVSDDLPVTAIKQ